jgi:predicted RND superfamily exporter protein
MSHFKNHYEQSRLYLRIAIFLGVISVIQPVFIIKLLQEADEKKVVVMDAGSNFHLVKSKSFKDAKKLQIECVKFAVKSLLDRSYRGVDDQQGLEQAFLMKNCEKQIEKIIKKEQKEFNKKNINQDCEIGKIHVLRQKKAYYLANVTGQLIRTCKYMNHSFIDVKLFWISLLLYRNPDISANGKMPLCVVKIINYRTKEKK